MALLLLLLNKPIERPLRAGGTHGRVFTFFSIFNLFVFWIGFREGFRFPDKTNTLRESSCRIHRARLDLGERNPELQAFRLQATGDPVLHFGSQTPLGARPEPSNGTAE